MSIHLHLVLSCIVTFCDLWPPAQGTGKEVPEIVVWLQILFWSPIPLLICITDKRPDQCNSPEPRFSHPKYMPAENLARCLIYNWDKICTERERISLLDPLDLLGGGVWGRWEIEFFGHARVFSGRIIFSILIFGGCHRNCYYSLFTANRCMKKVWIKMKLWAPSPGSCTIACTELSPFVIAVWPGEKKTCGHFSPDLTPLCSWPYFFLELVCLLGLVW